MVGKRNGMWRLVMMALALSAGVACGKGKTPTSPSGNVSTGPAATQVGIALQGLAIDGQYTMNVGDRLQVSAMVTMSDGSREDRTSTATWSSENPAIASVTGGLIVALAGGETVVTARYDQVLARLTVTVRGGGGDGAGDPGPGGGSPSRSLSHIEIEAAPSVAIGRGTPLALVAYYSDRSRETVSDGVSWRVDPSSLASVRDGQLWGVAAGTVTVTAAYDGAVDSHTAEVSATTASVIGVSIGGNPAVTVGGATQLVAVARLSDGTQQSTTTLAQWQSGNAGVATVTDGLVRGVSVGTSRITATIAGITADATVTVSSAGPGAVTSLAISGTRAVAVGATTSLTATARMADGSEQDVTSSAQWNTSNGGVATVAAGLVSGVATGSVTISAQYQGLGEQATVSVTGGSGGGGGGGTPTLAGLSLQGGTAVVAGQTLQLAATASFSDGSTQNVTAGVTWSSSAPGVLSVTGGLVAGVSAGTATVTGVYQGQSASRQITVSGSTTPAPPTVVGLNVTGNLALGIGVSSQLSVRASLSDGTSVDVTSQASYQSSNPLFVSVSSGGRLTGLLAGLANVTATYQGVSANVQVTISVALPVVSGLTINGASSVKVLQLLNLTAVASLSDGSQQTVTEHCQWSSSNLGILEFLTNGVLRALLVGNVTVTADYEGKTAQKTVAVTLF